MQLVIYWISGANIHTKQSMQTEKDYMCSSDFRHCMLVHNHDFLLQKPFCAPFSGKVTSILHPRQSIQLNSSRVEWNKYGYGIVCPILINHANVFKFSPETSIISHVEHRTAPSVERNFFLEDDAPGSDVIPNQNQLDIKHTYIHSNNRRITSL